MKSSRVVGEPFMSTEVSQGQPLSEAASILWAKLDHNDGQIAGYHPLILHMVDVALVTRGLWSSAITMAAKERLSRALKLEDAETAQWMAFFGGLHDIGKASPVFQLQENRMRAKLEKAGLPCPHWMGAVAHGVITTICLRKVLRERLGFPERLAHTIATVLGGHHGIFPTSDRMVSAARHEIGEGKWDETRWELVCNLATTLGMSNDVVPRGDVGNADAMFMAGLFSVSDWIGSAEDYFPYAASYSSTAESINLKLYVADREKRMRAALDHLGWTALSPQRVAAFTDLFPDKVPRPVQDKAASLSSVLEVPCLLIIEVPTGEGKTEAAMFLADSWNARHGQSGYYFALPTQATSNQMFLRVRDFLSTRYSNGVAHLQLLHGHASLSAEFEELRRNGNRLFRLKGLNPDADRSDRGISNVAAAEWFTYRKRGLLAPFGVGTVDQSLLAVLQSRHMFVRLFGLSGKTVILDEIHAYDTYMTKLLERLLEWLAALGSSVVILSATLPQSRKEALAAAYARGLGLSRLTVPHATRYPRVSWVSPSGADASEVGVSSNACKAIKLVWENGNIPADDSEGFELGERLRAVLANGGCAAVICNTVGKAQKMFKALEPYFGATDEDGLPELDLLHARYTFEERARRETNTLFRFGKPDAEVPGGDGQTKFVKRPYRSLLVSTQIIEQSLDIDFDLIVSEIAPVDLLLQRAGRLHRHERPHRPSNVAEPTLWVLSAETTDKGTPLFDRGTESVYDRHVLLRTWLQLRDRHLIRVPDDVESLIEEVYDDRPVPKELSLELHGEWKKTKEEYIIQMERDEYEARNRWLRPPTYNGPLGDFTSDPKEEDSPEFHAAHQALTRLSQPTVNVVCLHEDEGDGELYDRENGRSRPDAEPTIEQTKRLLRHSVPVSDRRVVRELLSREPPEGWRRSPLLRHHRLLMLDQDGRAEVGGYQLVLDKTIGLTIGGSKKVST